MLPHVILHNAVSVDGRIDWFPADVAKYYELTAYWKENATLAGTDTLLKAYPEERLSTDDEEAFQHEKPKPNDTRPLLIVADSRGRLRRILGLIWHEPYWRDLVVMVSHKTPKSYIDFLEKHHIDYLPAGEDRIDFRSALETLFDKYEARVIRVDSGGTLNGILLRAGLVNEISLLVHPYLVGGTSPASIYIAPDIIAANSIHKLKLINVQQLEKDLIWIRYEVLK